MNTASSQTHHPINAPTELFADSFDEWIEPKNHTPGAGPDSITAAKWTAWPSVEGLNSRLDETDIITAEPALTPPRSKHRQRNAGFMTLGLGALLLIAPLLQSKFSRQSVFSRQLVSASAMTGLAKVSMQKRMIWQKAVAHNAFEMARWQARRQKHNLNTHQRYALTQKAVLQTINTGGPDYENFSQAKTAGVVDSKLWNLAWSNILRGGTLPPQKTVRHTPIIAQRITKRPAVRVARRIRRRAPQKQAVILGRGPVREDSASIILIRD